MGSEDRNNGAAAAAAAALDEGLTMTATTTSQNKERERKKTSSTCSLVTANGDDDHDSPQQQESSSSCPRWSRALASPRGGAGSVAFSPARDVKEGGQFGWALLATLDRARNVTRCSRRTISLLQDVTQTYDQFAQALLKAGQSLNPLIAAYSGNDSSRSTILQQQMVFWSGETSRLSSDLRTEIAVPLQQFFNTAVGDSLQGMQEKYTQSRQKCSAIRQRTIRARAKYVKALRDVEHAMAEWKNKQQQSSSVAALASSNNKNSLPAPIKVKLKLVDRRAKHYKGLVEWENECVRQCELLEVMVLETLQTLERDRILHFAAGMGKALTCEKRALAEVVASMDHQPKAAETSNSSGGTSSSSNGTATPNPSPTNSETSTASADHGGNNNTKMPFQKIRRSVSLGSGGGSGSSSSTVAGAHAYDEGSGIMDAETLGLPPEVGKLRDTIRCRVQSRSTRVQQFHMMRRFLDYIIAALERFSSGMKQIVRKQESGDKGLESVHNEMKGIETSDLLQELTGRLIETLGIEADQAVACAKNLKKIKGENLEAVVLYGGKLLKAASDSEELSWKKLCDAARSRTKAEDRYRQTAADSQKARDRATSVDSGKSSSMMSKQVSKSLANVLSVLPNRGEHAMKILAPGTVAGIVQHTLEEADEKESKGRMELDSAVDTTEQLISKYKTNAQKWIDQFDAEDRDGWGDLKPAIDSFSTEILATRNSILTTLDSWKEESISIEDISASCDTAAKQWVSDLLPQAPSESTMAAVSDSSHQIGYKTTFVLESSPTVGHLLPDPESYQSDQGIDEEFDAEDEKQDGEAVSENGNAPAGRGSIFGSHTSSRDEDEPPVLRESNSGPGDENQSPANWLGFPMSDSFRDKLLFRKKAPRFYKRCLDVTTETDLFASYFCPDGRVDPKALPAVIDSFACSFREGTEKVPSHYGRVFLSDARLVFASWSGKQHALGLTDELGGVEAVPDPLGGYNDTLQLALQTAERTQTQLPVYYVGGLDDQQNALDLIERGRELATIRATELAEEERRRAEQTEAAGTPVPEDNILPKMEVVLRKHLRNISVQRFYEIVWAEGKNTKEAPLLQPFLEQDCMDVEVGDWEDGEFTGPWCGEKYQQKRVVQFKVKRKTHLYIGPPIANVVQTQYCRVEQQDTCVMAMTVDCEGIPYADTFAVEVRWVARRDGESDLCVETGLFVDFKKSTMFASQIRSGTTEETTDVAKDQFAYIKKACLAAGGGEVEEVADETEAEEASVAEKVAANPYQVVQDNLVPLSVALFALLLWRFWSSRSNVLGAHIESQSAPDISYLGERIDQLEAEIKHMRQTMDEILDILKNQN